MTKLFPCGDRVVLKKIKHEEQKTPSGLLLPDSMPKQDRYEIVVGWHGGRGLDEGSIVYIDKYKAFEIKLGDETFYVVNDEDIIAFEGE